MIHLGASDDLLRKYQEITPAHLTIEKEITEENRFGQGTHALPWFWWVGGSELVSGSDLSHFDQVVPQYSPQRCNEHLRSRVQKLYHKYQHHCLGCIQCIPHLCV